MIAKWKREVLDGTKENFARKGKKDFSQEADIKTLQSKIGKVVVGWGFLAKAFDCRALLEGAISSRTVIQYSA